MRGLMMDYPLVIPKILERARRVYPESEVVSYHADGKHVYNWGEFFGRVVRLMNVLRKLGVKPGDRVATFAWNHNRHLELYYAVPCMGAVIHTLNIRLFPEQLSYIVNHAEDKLIFVDDSLLKPIEALAGEFKTVEKYIVMGESGKFETSLSPVEEYEALMSAADDTEDFPEIDENDASGLCYTSGTTGSPKGALYSHRAVYIHTLMACLADGMALTDMDTVLPVVPMFHANAWSVPYNAAMMGSRLVFAGANVMPDNLVRIINAEKVTMALGVPTIWNGMLQHLRQSGERLDTVHTMLIGGSATPKSMIEAFKKEFNVDIMTGWGMTEMTPLGSTGRLTRKMTDWPEDKKFDYLAKAGRPSACVEMKIINDQGEELPWDGESTGELLVRGPAVVAGYYKNEEASKAAISDDGWFHTGDVAFIDENAVMTICDRTKDLIKSGGEWISSVEMENATMAIKGILEAAVVARPDEKWDERPVVFVVPSPGETGITPAHILKELEKEFAKWQLPAEEDIRIIEEVPKTSVGKFDKKVLRAKFL